MKVLEDAESFSLWLLGPEDLDAVVEVLERPQTMRMGAIGGSRDAIASWISSGDSSDRKVMLAKGKPDGYLGGLVILESKLIDGVSTRTLAYSFDRCIEGRNWAIQCIQIAAKHNSLDDTVCLIGPSMANSERVAKALGYTPNVTTDIDGISYKVMRFPS